MKKIILTIITIFSTLAVADNVGNGGGGVVCRDSNRNIRSVELLDLWESTSLDREKLWADGSTQNEYLEKAQEKMSEIIDNQNFVNKVKENLQYILAHTDNLENVAPGGAITPPSDARNDFFKANCPLEGVAVYDDFNNRLIIDRSLYEVMSPLHQAALIMHEAIYLTLRQEHSINSLLARDIVGGIFTDSRRKFFGEKTYSCIDEEQSLSFYFFTNGFSKTQLLLEKYDNKAVPTRAYYSLPSLADVIGKPDCDSSGSYCTDSDYYYKSKITVPGLAHKELELYFERKGFKSSFMVYQAGELPNNELSNVNKKIECTESF